MPALMIEMAAASLAYLAASLITFQVLMPVQNLFFPSFSSHASLLFLPHGVRVLAGWLLGWRAVLALLPGVFVAFVALIGFDEVMQPSRLAVLAVAVLVAPAVFCILARLGWDIMPHPDRSPCWVCVIAAGMLISVLNALLTNALIGSAAEDYIAFLIGDFFGLLTLMLILMYLFRSLRLSGN